MKEKHFFITAIIIVFVIIAGYLIISIVSPFEPQEAELPPLPEQIVLETDIYLDYDSLPEAEDIPWEEYPCDLTPIINAIKELDKDFDETGYKIDVDNYSYEKNGIDGWVQFVPSKDKQRFYGAGIRQHKLIYVSYEKEVNTPMKEKWFFITAIIIVFVIIAGNQIISIVSPFEPQ